LQPPVLVPQQIISVVFPLCHESPLGEHQGVYKAIDSSRGLLCRTVSNYITTVVTQCLLCCLSEPAQFTRDVFLAPEVAVSL
jgi:hypothetical protein